MANEIEHGEALFLDTSFAIALAVASDQHHARAIELVAQADAAQSPLITTTAILIEIGSALAATRHRVGAAEMLRALETDRRATIVGVGNGLYRAGLKLFMQRPNKSWSLTDCISFTVMDQQKILRALTADHHFVQAGFVALLL